MRNESLYNLAQENEIFVLLRYLPCAVVHVVEDDSLWKGEGRPPKELYDVLVCLVIQHHINWSSRRSIGMIKLLCKFARIPVDVPSWRTLCRYREKSVIKNYLDKLIRITSNPLNLIEQDFSTDMTGTSTKCFSTWFSLRCKKRIRRRDHIATHITTSGILNSCVAIDVDCKKGKDSEYLRKHIKQISQDFLINDWCGDSKYLSRENCNEVAKAGGSPWFKPKKNTTKRPSGSPSWKQMVKTAQNNPDEFSKHYHKRSNVESTFSAKKRKFGNSVRTKLDDAKENEEHLKWVGYNFSVLSRAHYEHNLKIKF